MKGEAREELQLIVVVCSPPEPLDALVSVYTEGARGGATRGLQKLNRNLWFHFKSATAIDEKKKTCISKLVEEVVVSYEQASTTF